MNKQLMLAGAALTLCLASANGEIVTINFEDLAVGARVTSQYASLGVHFSMYPVNDPAGVLHTSVEVLSYQLGYVQNKAAGIWGSSILLTFDSDISNFSVVMYDTDRGSLLGRVRAYDAQGHLMAHITDMTGPYNAANTYQNTLRADVGGIRFVELTSDADGAIFDNITFTRIPSPEALAVLPLGLLGLGRRKRSCTPIGR